MKKQKLFERGAEAVVTNSKFIHRDVVIKERIEKRYRNKNIDSMLRKSRTKAEVRLLHRAKCAGVPCPTVLCVEDFSLIMTRINGSRPRMTEAQAKMAGKYLALLHNNGVIHGDYTPANLLASGKSLYVIDFGLGFFSRDVEDMAVDVFTMLKSLKVKRRKSFLVGYRACKQYNAVIKRLDDISKRMRYAS
ncbi:MAG: KEOPS complex kinase/ATPase Bud32 [Candidatus Bilamarchaeaceae archaeon]